MRALIFVKRHRLHHVLVRLPSLLSTFSSHKQFQAAATQPPVATNLIYLPFFLPTAVAQQLGRVPKNDYTTAETRFERG
jgi:hypothetical protein